MRRRKRDPKCVHCGAEVQHAPTCPEWDIETDAEEVRYLLQVFLSARSVVQEVSFFEDQPWESEFSELVASVEAINAYYRRLEEEYEREHS